jgi:CubicO group peptidase (beta-lactamase class C family)
VGTLVKDDRLDVDARAPVPEWSGQGDPRHAITLDDLLRMSSGLEWSEQPYPRVSDLTRMLTSRDAAAFVAAKDLAHEPGTRFQYNTGNTILVDAIMADEVGSAAAFRRFMDAKLLDRIGMRPLHVRFYAAGTWLGRVGRGHRAGLRQARAAVPARRRLGRRAHPPRGLGPVQPHAERVEPSTAPAGGWT